MLTYSSCIVFVSLNIASAIAHLPMSAAVSDALDSVFTSFAESIDEFVDNCRLLADRKVPVTGEAVTTGTSTSSTMHQ